MIMRTISLYAVPVLLLLILLAGVLKKQPVYELFVSGAAEGVQMAVQILPYIMAMLVAVGVFRASGAFAALSALISPLTDWLGLPTEILPLALIRPLSGSGALGLSADIINTSGPDSFAGQLASVMQGSTDTTFYVLAVYYGSVGIKKYRYSLPLGLSADFVSFAASFIICSLMFR